ncbi:MULTISPECIES: bifunctional 3-(3-hydroxy-phenyl)propionate/3-hydroxycinnamic acid hydroxylase [unclassified Burkholderia]|uniref:bifunctional 3-(3-hydroxy-phenyl)propionate/3-hydroxycinnamic acid hydroxylase n=1 Tax=unclassified Burkholderia TaxID=2613784 RepID=UPI0019822EFE|nr:MULTISPECIES: bifunctional 3-(3-hydroxy-phenyl)propionate/3-hydroxycinnamic acid hydroxylase [unclassified Burkholderia]MBN3744360.1 bifunctional 3-(3-hydroxy-phenyl)propionate/3-hydroxycinnamic acid hydroxylase [Burkholderia sp. Se-20373]MBN3768406.1 bifunctional 3-(3-hydroxy-phenyl)propionate/3-hydroxycinnamic acid hydroxylase [Burkholderia sp. Se-20378]MBN3793642.1 bifunctional 3-(3-hydroxy-phenyl)propionate/3-hydroxycinnamic acid hydroxylase [Burkholderia sp. Ac-20392]
MDLKEINTSVLIVGGGPTGLSLANVLGQDGIECILLDRKTSTVAEPRAVSIDDESLRTMQAIGLIEPVMRDVVPGYGVHYLTRVGGRCFGRVEPTASEYGYPRRNAFRQPLFEASVHEGLNRFKNVQALFGHILESFYQEQHGVHATVRCPDGTALSIRARYLVGCDGGRSPIRGLLGVKMVGSTFKSRWLVIDTENDDDSFSQMRVYCDPRRAVVDVPGPHKTRRFEILIHSHESADDVVTEAQVRKWLFPFRGSRKTDIVRKTVYTFHARVAEHWQVGRVYLAGDAAHLTPPYAGQGMNSGVRDAHNLGWKLSAVVRGQLPESVLLSYEIERRKHAWALIRLALNLGMVMAPKSRCSAWAWQSFFRIAAYVPPVRDYFLQMKFKPKPRYACGLLGPIDELGRHSVRGRMLPQPFVTSRGRSMPLDDLLGPRFALLRFGRPSVGTSLRPAHQLWRHLGAATVWILPEPNGVSERMLEQRGWTVAVSNDSAFVNALAHNCDRVIVLRPDRYAAGAFLPSQEHTFADEFATVLGVDATISVPGVSPDDSSITLPPAINWISR